MSCTFDENAFLKSLQRYAAITMTKGETASVKKGQLKGTTIPRFEVTVAVGERATLTVQGQKQSLTTYTITKIDTKKGRVFVYQVDLIFLSFSNQWLVWPTTLGKNLDNIYARTSFKQVKDDMKEFQRDWMPFLRCYHVIYGIDPAIVSEILRSESYCKSLGYTEEEKEQAKQRARARPGLPPAGTPSPGIPPAS